MRGSGPPFSIIGLQPTLWGGLPGSLALVPGSRLFCMLEYFLSAVLLVSSHAGCS